MQNKLRLGPRSSNTQHTPFLDRRNSMANMNSEIVNREWPQLNTQSKEWVT